MEALLKYWSRLHCTPAPEEMEQRMLVLLGVLSLVVAWKIRSEWAGSYVDAVGQLTCVDQMGKLQVPRITIGRTAKDWVAACRPVADAWSASVPPVRALTWNCAGWVPGP